MVLRILPNCRTTVNDEKKNNDSNDENENSDSNAENEEDKTNNATVAT